MCRFWLGFVFLIAIFAFQILPRKYLYNQWKNKSTIYHKVVEKYDYWIETGVYGMPDDTIIFTRLIWFVAKKKNKKTIEYFVVISGIMAIISLLSLIVLPFIDE